MVLIGSVHHTPSVPPDDRPTDHDEATAAESAPGAAARRPRRAERIGTPAVGTQRRSGPARPHTRETRGTPEATEAAERPPTAAAPLPPSPACARLTAASYLPPPGRPVPEEGGGRVLCAARSVLWVSQPRTAPRAFLPPHLSSSSLLLWQRELRRQQPRVPERFPPDLRGELGALGRPGARDGAAHAAQLQSRRLCGRAAPLGRAVARRNPCASPRFAEVEKAVSVFADYCVHF